MKIEIDTREESAQDLRRIARLLEQLADKAPAQSGSSADDAADPSAMPGAFGMFDDDDDDDEGAGGRPAERASADEDFRITTY